MGRGITRRDFLNGVAFAAGAAMLPSQFARGRGYAGWAGTVVRLLSSCLEPGFAAAIPDRLTRRTACATYFLAAGRHAGDHQGILHLVVVGGGISGFRRHFFRKRPDRRLESSFSTITTTWRNAKRNEFSSASGPFSVSAELFIESPAPYSSVAKD